MSAISSTPSTSSSQQTGLSNGTTGNPQSPVGSPPLILAFLAIGIFSAAMIAVFGWRRVQFGRESGLWGYPNTLGNSGRRITRGSDSTGQAGSNLGEKPVLWEVWVNRDKNVEGGEHRLWDNTMPLAVLPAPRSGPSGRILSSRGCSSSRPLSPSGSVGSPELRSLFPLPQTAESQRRQHLNEIGTMSILRRHPHTNTAPNAHSNSVEEEHSNEKDEEEEEKDARIVMIIELPSLTMPRYRHAQSSGHKRRSSHYSSLSASETLVDNTGRMQEDLLGTSHDSGQFQYCIGVHTCPWPLSTTFPTTSNHEAERIPHPHVEKELG